MCDGGLLAGGRALSAVGCLSRASLLSMLSRALASSDVPLADDDAPAAPDTVADVRGDSEVGSSCGG